MSIGPRNCQKQPANILAGVVSTKWNASSATLPVWRVARLCPPRSSPNRKASSCRTRSSCRRSPANGLTTLWAISPSRIWYWSRTIPQPRQRPGHKIRRFRSSTMSSPGFMVPTAPRNVLKRVCALFEAEGLIPVVAPEMEFFLVARNIDPEFAGSAANGSLGPPRCRQAYSLSAVDEYGRVIMTSTISRPKALRSTASCKKAARARSRSTSRMATRSSCRMRFSLLQAPDP